MDINDGYLLKKVIEFCEKIDKKSLKGTNLKLVQAGQSSPITFKHPLDGEVEEQLQDLNKKLECSNEECPELPYTECIALE